jgi:hypothetical protein
MPRRRIPEEQVWRDRRPEDADEGRDVAARQLDVRHERGAEHRVLPGVAEVNRDGESLHDARDAGRDLPNLASAIRARTRLVRDG